jgi:hypothetical protein
LPTPWGAFAEPSDGCWIDTGGPEDAGGLDEALGAGAGAGALDAGALDSAGAGLAAGDADELDGVAAGAGALAAGAAAAAAAGAAAGLAGFGAGCFLRTGGRARALWTGWTAARVVTGVTGLVDRATT